MAVKELSDGNPDGTRLGQSATDLVGFYGATPAAQPATLASAGSSVASVKAKVNGLITRLRTLGLLNT